MLLILPVGLFAQLKIGGKMVIPIGQEAQKMYSITKIDEKSYQKKNMANLSLCPSLKAWHYKIFALKTIQRIASGRPSSISCIQFRAFRSWIKNFLATSGIFLLL